MLFYISIWGKKQTETHTYCILLHFFLSVVLSSSFLAPVLRGLINKAGEDWGACSDKGCSLGESRNLSYHTVRGQRRAAGLSAFWTRFSFRRLIVDSDKLLALIVASADVCPVSTLHFMNKQRTPPANWHRCWWTCVTACVLSRTHHEGNHGMNHLNASFTSLFDTRVDVTKKLLSKNKAFLFYNIHKKQTFRFHIH